MTFPPLPDYCEIDGQPIPASYAASQDGFVGEAADVCPACRTRLPDDYADRQAALREFTLNGVLR